MIAVQKLKERIFKRIRRVKSNTEVTIKPIGDNRPTQPERPGEPVGR